MPAFPRLPRRTRTATLVVHVTASSAWSGILLTLIVLSAIQKQVTDSWTIERLTTTNATIISRILLPTVAIAIVSGLVLAAGTPWGLTKYWWIVAKCSIAVGLTTTGAVLTMLHTRPDLARMLGLGALAVAIGISVAKPWGKTPRGRATQAINLRRPRHRATN